MRETALTSILLGGLLAGCSTTPTTEEADLLDQPIDCATADIDVAALEAAIPGAAQRLAAGVRLIVPVSRIVGRATGQLDERREIASGRTEAQLRARIEEIKAACPVIQKYRDPAHVKV